MKSRTVLLWWLVAAGLCLPLAGCAWLMRSPPPPPRNSAWHSFTNGQGRENIIHVQINPVGPPRWKYLVECLHPVAITNSPPPGWSGTTSFPPWHAAGIALTNVAIDAPGCNVLDVSSGWQVSAGTNYVFTHAGGGASELRFTLEGDKTNGAVEVRLSDAAGADTAVKNLEGPR